MMLNYAFIFLRRALILKEWRYFDRILLKCKFSFYNLRRLKQFVFIDLILNSKLSVQLEAIYTIFRLINDLIK